MRKAVLVRTDTVANLVLTIPVARSIKERNPDLTVTMLVSRYSAPLVQAEPYIDEIMAVADRSLKGFDQVNGLTRDLKRSEADAIIFFYPRLSLALAAKLAGIRLRVGTRRRAYSVLFNRRINLARRNSGRHELDLNYDLAEALFPDLPRYEPNLTVSMEDLDGARRSLADCGIGDNDRFIVVHPLSHGSAPNWRIERYASLTQQLVEDGKQVVITGSQLERDIIDDAFASLSGKVSIIAGETDLSALKGIISRAELIVSGSTGPIHIAAAVGTFAVGIYPPAAQLSPIRWGPRGGANKLFAPLVESEGGDMRAVMDSIPVEAVREFITERLSADRVEKNR